MSVAVQEKLVSAAAVAEVLSVKRATVLDLAKRGVIPAVRLGPRVIRFALSEVLQQRAAVEAAK